MELAATCDGVSHLDPNLKHIRRQYNHNRDDNITSPQKSNEKLEKLDRLLTTVNMALTDTTAPAYAKDKPADFNNRISKVALVGVSPRIKFSSELRR